MATNDAIERLLAVEQEARDVLESARAEARGVVEAAHADAQKSVAEAVEDARRQADERAEARLSQAHEAREAAINEARANAPRIEDVDEKKLRTAVEGVVRAIAEADAARRDDADPEPDEGR